MKYSRLYWIEAMPDYRGRKGSVEDLLPDDRREWAEGIWQERDQIASEHNGAWMLGEAAKALGLAPETVDALLRRHGGT